MVNIISRKNDYSDLDLDFMPHPTTKDVMKKTGIEAIKRSVRNLLLTNFYDRPFQSQIGSNALKLLFDNASPITANFLTNAIRETLNNFEPRIRIDRLEVNFDFDNNGYNVRLFFVVLNRNEPAAITLFLERIR
jgi:phage baseplate assembly protein W